MIKREFSQIFIFYFNISIFLISNPRSPLLFSTDLNLLKKKYYSKNIHSLQEFDSIKIDIIKISQNIN